MRVNVYGGRPMLVSKLVDAIRQVARGEVTDCRIVLSPVFGNLVLALPISLTRESLRPYAVAGLGWIHASASDSIGFNAVSNDFLGLALGVGAIGFVTDTTGLRFDLRYLKSVSSGDVSELNRESARIRFWRATVGLVLR